MITAFTARSPPHGDDNRYSARESRQGKPLRIRVRLDASLVLSHDFHISADYPRLGTDHIHLFTRIPSDIENRGDDQLISPPHLYFLYLAGHLEGFKPLVASPQATALLCSKTLILKLWQIPTLPLTRPILRSQLSFLLLENGSPTP